MVTDHVSGEAAQAADHYVQRLDLGADPFSAGFKNDYFYSGGMRRQLLDQLIHFCHFSDQVVLLTGSAGSGTSTLLMTMISQLQAVMDCAVLNGESLVTPEQLLKSLSEQLQLEATTAADLLSALQQPTTGYEEIEPVLIAVDQASFLSLECFELLRLLVEETTVIVHLLLVGEYQLEPLSKLAGFDNEQIKLLEIEPLTASDAGDYLLGLLQSVGYAGEQPLSTDQLVVLQQQAGGNISEINKLVPALLAADVEVDVRPLQFSLPVAHVAAIGLLVVALILAYFYQGTSSPMVVEEIELSAEGVLKNPQDHIKPSRVERLVKLEPVSRQIVPKPSAAVKRTDERLATVESATKKEQIADAVIGAGIEKPVKKPPTVAVLKSKTKPLLESVKKPVVRPEVAQAVVTPKSIQKDIVSPTPTKSTRLAVKTVDSKVPARERRLLKLPADAYMLQLMGGLDEPRVRGQVKLYVGRLSVTYYEGRRKGKPWYVVVAGPYDNKLEARRAIKVLPESLQKQKPWVRSVASIQKDIRKSR